MIFAYLNNARQQIQTFNADDQQTIQHAIWIDLLNPTKEEEWWLEKILNLDIPTREEMQEIELSSRLYKENDALFMTVMMIERSASCQPISDAVTFILTDTKFITVRYIQPHSFAIFSASLAKMQVENLHATALLTELLDISIDRLADILENVSSQLDFCSKTIFKPSINNTDSQQIDYKNLLQKIGISGDLNTKVEESLMSFDRLMTFFGKKYSAELDASIQSKLSMIAKDAKSLSDHVIFLSNKITFLLDATLGMINIEQNNIIKIFSIVSVILLPPTLIASIYGMNFKFIPELTWYFGYPMSITLMLISALMPYLYFKKKKWL